MCSASSKTSRKWVYQQMNIFTSQQTGCTEQPLCNLGEFSYAAVQNSSQIPLRAIFPS